MNQDQEDRERWRDDGGWVNTSEEKVTKPDRRKHARTPKAHPSDPPRSIPKKPNASEGESPSE